jgi:hypothetical protein
VIKRAAIAVRKDWCNNVFKMARICLEAATQDDHDLLALMPGAVCAGQGDRASCGAGALLA